jgi:hypothetical protein
MWNKVGRLYTKQEYAVRTIRQKLQRQLDTYLQTYAGVPTG